MTIITVQRGDDNAASFSVSAPLFRVIETYDPFQQGWYATTPDDFRALLRETLDAPTFNDSEIRRAAQL